MKTNLFLILSFTILAMAFARSTENNVAKANELNDQYKLVIEDITKPITLLLGLFEACAPSQISFEDGPWFIFERLNTDECKTSLANLVRDLPSIRRSMAVISKMFLHENQLAEKGEF